MRQLPNPEQVSSPESSWRLRIKADAADGATVLVRKHQFRVGAPLQFDVEYPHVTALEQVLGAFGSDLVGGLWLAARRRRVELESTEATMEGWLDNPLSYLGVVGEVGHPGLCRIKARVYVSTLHSEAELAPLWQEMLQRSPLVATFRHLDLDLSYKLVL